MYPDNEKNGLLKASEKHKKHKEERKDKENQKVKHSSYDTILQEL